MTDQLTLSIQLHDDATFENFYQGENKECVQTLATSLQDDDHHVFYLWGKVGSGCSHLLQASYYHVIEQGNSAFYLSLSDAKELTPDVFDGMEALHTICLDDIEAIAGNAEWEEALFHLYNRIREQGHKIIVANSVSPTHSLIQLADLRSRLAWGIVYHIQTLSDDEKVAALQLRAKNRGFELSSDVAEYVIRHYSRNMHELYEQLALLDTASLQQQRRLTIPFVKTVLDTY